MWNSVLTGVRVQNKSPESTSILQLQDQWRQNNKKLLLKHFFEEWKNFAKDKPAAENSRKKRETACTKFDRQKKNLYCSWNCIDLNKMLLKNEVELLRKFWDIWKGAVKNNRGLPKANIKTKKALFPKAKCFQKLNQDMNPSWSGIHCTVINELYRDINRDITKKYFNLWKETTSRQLTPEITAVLESNVKYWANPEKTKTSDTVCALDSQCASGEITDIGILRDHLNMWRTATNSSHAVKKQDMPTSTIEKFLTAVKAAKMKTAKILKSNHSILHSSHLKRRKSHNSDSWDMNDQSEGVEGWNSVPFVVNQPPLKVNVLIDSRDNKNCKTISSIKKEVNMSLEEAHSLLESTIAASYRRNCSRRKAFKRCNRKGSPLPAEMPAGDLVERMRVRELERAARWQQSRQRKERLEDERMMKILEGQKEDLRQKELSKKLKHLEQKEKKMEKMQQEKYLEDIRQKYQQQNLKALKHYNKKLLQKALQLFINEVNTTAALELEATAHHEKTIIWRKFNDWKNVTYLNCERRISSAVEFHKKILLRLYFKNLCRMQREYTLNKQAAVDLCEMRSQEKAFLRWNQYTCDVMIEMNLKAEIADMFYMRCLLKKTLHCWKRLPSVLESERARERIKNSFRMKVLEIFPDFCPQLEEDL